jgi:broad specificity phosphatase PhoE
MNSNMHDYSFLIVQIDRYDIMLYIRHGQKAYSNGKADKFCFDPPLTEQGKTASITRFSNLLLTQGLPQRIISSPYLRARETAQIAHDVILQLTGISIPVSYDPLLGEYLGNQKRKELYDEVRPETLELNPIPPEDWHDYSARIRRHLTNARESTWYITHGVVIQSVAYFVASKKLSHPGELSGIFVNNNTITAI